MRGRLFPDFENSKGTNIRKMVDIQNSREGDRPPCPLLSRRCNSFVTCKYSELFFYAMTVEEFRSEAGENQLIFTSK